MNRREKKKFKKKYQSKILNAIILEKRYIGENQASERLKLLEEIKMFVDVCDFSSFYSIHERGDWPYANRLNILRDSDLSRIRTNEYLNREVFFKEIGI